MADAVVVSIHLAPSAAAPMISVMETQAVTGKGLQGDRYFNRLGTYSNEPGSGREVTLIEIEAFEALRREYQVELKPGQSRRNIVTRNVALNHLIDKEFKIGTAIMRGTRLCEPCAHLERLSVKGSMRGLIHRGGLRAEVVQSGTIRALDRIVVRSPK